MIGEKIGRFCELLLVRNTGITLVHVLNGIHEIDTNLAALILKYSDQMVKRNWRLRLIYLMRTPGEDMRLQWTFWNLVNIGGIAEGHLFGENIQVRDIQEYPGENKWERLHAMVEKESQRMDQPLKILCVCTGNVDRSPLVEAYLRHEFKAMGLGEAVSVESRGVLPREGRPASPPTVRLAEELGIDLSRHRARVLTRQEVKEADFILAMKDKHYRAIVKMDPSAPDRTMILNIDDPAVELYIWEDTERYRDVLIQVKNAIGNFLNNLSCTTELIQSNLQQSQFQKQVAVLDHYDELHAHVSEFEGKALLIADDAMGDKDRVTYPPFFPRQAMGIIGLSLLASVGHVDLSQFMTRLGGVFVLNRIPRLTPPW